MKCLVNFITRRKNGNISTKPKEIEASSIGIGRSTDQEIFLADLRVAYKHAEIVALDEGCFIKSQALSGIKVDGNITSSVLLLPGVVIQIGNYQLKVIEQAGYDLAIEVEQVLTSDKRDEEIKLESKLDLNQTKLSKRLLSWICFTTVFVLFFILPLSSSLFVPVKDLTKTLPIPSDVLWKAGSMASVHHFFKNDCHTCHVSAFRQVKDGACSSCHDNTHNHAADELMVNDNVNNIECQGCHKEHNGPDGMIMATSDDFCSDCHNDLKESLGGKTELLNVSDFGSDHPEFRPSIPQVKVNNLGMQVQKVSRIAMNDTTNFKEKNALLFSHKGHLNPDAPEKFRELTENGAEKMICNDCHVPDSGGKRMQAFSFEENCEHCHELKINDKQTQTSLQIPHETTAEVYLYIEQYYKALALEGGVVEKTAPASVRRRRQRVGQKISKEERLEALEWAAKKTEEVSSDVFTFTHCSKCHEISYSSTKTPSAKIVAVNAPDLWLPLANFNHAKHVTMECTDCHNVDQSENGSDVLLPKIANCRSCHGGAHSNDLLASGCVDCHSFHIGEELLHPQTPKQVLVETKEEIKVETN